jgi:hypothetical protein
MRMLILLWFLPCFFGQSVNAQSVDADLLKIKHRMDSIEQFTANLKLDIDISFIQMPTKYAVMTYKKGQPANFTSDNFVMIPKRGLDFTLTKIFEYPIITVERGTETKNGKTYKAINVIPTDKRADYSIATLLIDIENQRIAESEISTKKDGTYTLIMQYENDKMALPSLLEVDFEMDRIRIPFNFMGKDTHIDRNKMRSEELKTGKIFLRITNYQLNSKKGNL